MRPIARRALIAATTMILAGCGSSGTSEPSPSSDAALLGITASAAPSASVVDASPSRAVEPSTSGPPAVHISLPARWQLVEMTEDALTAQAEALEPSNPLIAEAVRQFLASGKSVQFYAIDYEGLTPVGTVNVIATSLGGMPLDAVLPLVEGQLEQAGAADITFGTTPVLGVDAVVIDYRTTAVGASPQTTILARLYLISVGETIYEVTVACFGSDVAGCRAEGEAMVHGMTVGP